MLAQASEAETRVSIVEVDLMLARDKMVTPRNHIQADRFPEEYG